MGLLKFNPLVEDASGMIGELVLVRYKHGTKITRRKPIRTAPITVAERRNQAKFADAIAWAKRVWAYQPELKARYVAAARLQHRRGFDLAKSDFALLPSIREIDLFNYTGQPGDSIRVEAVAVFEVKSVEVKVWSLAGAILEQGAAVFDGEAWVYTATVAVPAGQTIRVEAMATNYAEHSVSKKVDHACGP